MAGTLTNVGIHQPWNHPLPPTTNQKTLEALAAADLRSPVDLRASAWSSSPWAWESPEARHGQGPDLGLPRWLTTAWMTQGWWKDLWNLEPPKVRHQEKPVYCWELSIISGSLVLNSWLNTQMLLMDTIILIAPRGFGSVMFHDGGDHLFEPFDAWSNHMILRSSKHLFPHITS